MPAVATVPSSVDGAKAAGRCAILGNPPETA